MPHSLSAAKQAASDLWTSLGLFRRIVIDAAMFGNVSERIAAWRRDDLPRWPDWLNALQSAEPALTAAHYQGVPPAEGAYRNSAALRLIQYVEMAMAMHSRVDTIAELFGTHASCDLVDNLLDRCGHSEGDVWEKLLKDFAAAEQVERDQRQEAILAALTSGPSEQVSPVARAVAWMYDRVKVTGKVPRLEDVEQVVGVDRSTLYRDPAFTAARKALKENLARKVPRGSKDRDGNLDADDD